MKKGRGGLKHRLLFFKRERFLNFFYYSLNLYKAKILIFWRKTNLVYILLRVAKNSNLLVTHSHFTMSQWKKPYFWNGFCWAASLLFSFGLDPRCISDPELRDYLNADDCHLNEWELVSHYRLHPLLVPMSTMAYLVSMSPRFWSLQFQFLRSAIFLFVWKIDINLIHPLVHIHFALTS